MALTVSWWAIQEAALLRAVEEAVLALLAGCFEKYYGVSDQAATGILDGDVAATESPAPVLHHAVLLAGGVTTCVNYRCTTSYWSLFLVIAIFCSCTAVAVPTRGAVFGVALPDIKCSSCLTV